MSKTRTKKQISLILLGILGLSVTWATSSVLMFSPADNPAPATVNLFKLILSGENTEIQWKLNANKTLEIGSGRPGKNSVGSGISMIGGIGNRNRSAPDGGSAIVASRVSTIAS